MSDANEESRRQKFPYIAFRISGKKRFRVIMKHPGQKEFVNNMNPAFAIVCAISRLRTDSKRYYCVRVFIILANFHQLLMFLPALYREGIVH